MAQVGDFYRWKEGIDLPESLFGLLRYATLFKVIAFEPNNKSLTIDQLQTYSATIEMVSAKYETSTKIFGSKKTLQISQILLDNLADKVEIPPQINHNPDFNRFDLDI